MLKAHRRHEARGTHLGSRISAFSWLGGIAACSKDQLPTQTPLPGQITHPPVAPWHQPASAYAALPRGCRTEGTRRMGGSCPWLHSRMEIPESLTSGAEQVGKVLKWLSLIRFCCISNLMHLGSSVIRRNAFL